MLALFSSFFKILRTGSCPSFCGANPSAVVSRPFAIDNDEDCAAEGVTTGTKADVDDKPAEHKKAVAVENFIFNSSLSYVQ